MILARSLQSDTGRKHATDCTIRSPFLRMWLYSLVHQEVANKPIVKAKFIKDKSKERLLTQKALDAANRMRREALLVCKSLKTSANSCAVKGVTGSRSSSPENGSTAALDLRKEAIFADNSAK